MSTWPIPELQCLGAPMVSGAGKRDKLSSLELGREVFSEDFFSLET